MQSSETKTFGLRSPENMNKIAAERHRPLKFELLSPKFLLILSKASDLKHLKNMHWPSSIKSSELVVPKKHIEKYLVLLLQHINEKFIIKL